MRFFSCRLLNWAADIEQQISVQRQELRQAKIELVAAQEVTSGPDCHAAAVHEVELSTAQGANEGYKHFDGMCQHQTARVTGLNPKTLSDNRAHLWPLLDQLMCPCRRRAAPSLRARLLVLRLQS